MIRVATRGLCDRFLFVWARGFCGMWWWPASARSRPEQRSNGSPPSASVGAGSHVTWVGNVASLAHQCGHHGCPSRMPVFGRDGTQIMERMGPCRPRTAIGMDRGRGPSKPLSRSDLVEGLIRRGTPSKHE